MAHAEQALSSRTVFTGRIFTVTVDRVRLENGGKFPARENVPNRPYGRFYFLRMVGVVVDIGHFCSVEVHV